MDIHPSTKYDIVRLRNEERVSRGLAAHAALSALQGQSTKRDADLKPARQHRFLGRLHWREAGARGPSRPAI